MPESSEQLTLLSAFSGVGGLDLGLEAARFRHVGCIENDEAARRSIKRNRGDEWPLLEPGDISALASTLTPEQLGLERGQLSLLAGGPPCQPFSKAAQWSDSARIGLEDARSHCLHDFLTLVEQFLPRAVLMENVAGFIRGSVSALSEIEARLTEINSTNHTKYKMQHKVVDAVGYGVPQRRSRAIILITRDGETFRWPKPTHDDQPVRAWDAIGSLSPVDPPEAIGKWAGLLPSIPEGSNYLWHTSHGGGRSLFGYRTRFWSFLLKLAKDQPSWTLPAQPGPSTGPFHWDNRPLAVSEMLRLQSFPADWQVEGGQREQVRQVGNATPPLLAEVMGRAVASQLFGARYQGRALVHRIERVAEVPAASRPSAVPSSFLELEDDHDDHPGAGKGPSPRTTRPGSTRPPGVRSDDE
jgi:DNA (cytosine-5)-methyltransferase 1